ncbi:cytochrome oxidase assembly [Halobacteriales archaeon SW_7_68_16]|nr:MAG: cytochrome oxidase assembly [Halobacteriales archaeon SW_7_68_16]
MASEAGGMNRRFRHLAGVTTGLTFVLILLGLHTGSTGGGLTCGARWPLCNGWMGLFPANWASFFEWFHRLVAMVVGVLLLGVLYGAWRWQDDRRVRYSVTAAIVILPTQIVLGGVTTTAGGMFPQGFNPLVMFAHFSTATIIFTLLVYATARIYGTPAPPTNQAGYYAASFALLAALVALLVWSERAVRAPSLLRFRAVAALAGAVLYVDMVLSRHLFGVDAVVGEATTLVLAALVAGVALVANRTVPAGDPVTSQRAD